MYVTYENCGASEGDAPASSPGLCPEPIKGLTVPPPNPQLHFMMPTVSWSPLASNLFHLFSFHNPDRSVDESKYVSEIKIIL